MWKHRHFAEEHFKDMEQASNGPHRGCSVDLLTYQ